jgi:Cu/Ag efflux pump CusA
MTRETSLANLDEAIIELRNSIKNVSDAEVRKELEKTLKNLMKAREKMNPSKPFSSLYVVAIPFVVIFAMLGVYYFSCMSKKSA